MIQWFKILFASLVLIFSIQKANSQQRSDHYAYIDSLVNEMTLEEKVQMIHANSSFTAGGIQRLGIPEIVMSDGPHGVRHEFGRDWTPDQNVADSGTYLPTGVCLAATWNPDLGYSFGEVLGKEAAWRGKNIILGPGVNIIRTPLNGRNFEYLSEDPFLNSRMAVGYIKGVQDQGVAACVKHFALNNQEILRTSINVNLSERALREIYLPAFEAAVKEAGVLSVMGAYNKVRGQWATHNFYLVKDILKKEWQFPGVLMSDWNAVHNTAEAFWNGTDLEMGTDLGMLPNPDYSKFYTADTLLTLIKNKHLPEYILDDKVRRILYLMAETGQLFGKELKGAYNEKAHQATAKKVAEEGIVLLKNNDKLLPLNKEKIKSIAVIGLNAHRLQSMGGGSSQVKAFYEITPLAGIQNFVTRKTRVSYSQGYHIARNAGADKTLIEDAVNAAKNSELAIIVAGYTHGYDYSQWSDNAYDAEDTDKPDMHLPFGQDSLISEVLKANPRTIIVLIGGGPVDMNAWFSKAPAILQAWYPGMEGGNAIASILFGDVNPSGKLPMSFPASLSEAPAHSIGEYPGDKVNVHYLDDLYVGYRYYDTYNKEPLFPFGHGLSYTEFSYSDLKVEKTEGGYEVRFTIRNTGGVAGSEVAQLYLGNQQPALPGPVKELKGFKKVFLEPGQSTTVSIPLNWNSFKYFNDLTLEWTADKGRYNVWIGSSSRDIRLKTGFNADPEELKTNEHEK